MLSSILPAAVGFGRHGRYAGKPAYDLAAHVSAAVVPALPALAARPLNAEAAAVLLAMERRAIPPTVGTTQLDPEMTIDVVTGGARPWEPGPTLSNSFGFGGHNASLVLRLVG